MPEAGLSRKSKLAGLGFGGEFVPIYKAYEKAECVAVCPACARSDFQVSL